MKISIIVSVYKDTQALGLILKSLENQSLVPSEIVVSEDGNSKEMRDFLSQHKGVKHCFQEDNGWHKNKALNNAIKHSSGDLLIFLDGDCIPYSNLVENYYLNASPKTVLCGRRVELGEEYSQNLREKKITISDIEQGYLRQYFKMKRDKTRHYEEGIVLSSLFYKLKYRKKSSHILGCNFALNREDIEDINGFNEDYITPSVGEDTDIEYRLKLNGCIMKPTRNLTNIVHLYHKVTYNSENNRESNLVFDAVKESREIFCKNGLNIK